MYSHQTPVSRRDPWIRAAMILTVIALVLLIVGYVTPGWFYFSENGVTSHVGLWYLVRCDSGKCASFSNTQVFTTTFEEFQAETTISLVFGIVLLILLIMVILVTRTEVMISFAVFFAISSGILALVACGRLGDSQRQYSETNDTLKFPYSLFIFGIGGILNIIVGFLLIVYLCCGSKHNAYRERRKTREVEPYPSQPYPRRGYYGDHVNNGYYEDRYNVPYKGRSYHMNEYSRDPTIPYKTDHYYSDTRSHAPYSVDRYADEMQARDRYYEAARAPVHYPASRPSYDRTYDQISHPTYARDGYYGDFDDDKPYVVKVGSM